MWSNQIPKKSRYFYTCQSMKKCLEPESNQRHEDFQSSALPTELSRHVIKLMKLSSGDRIWTYDLRVMSPTSFQTAPPRDIKLYAPSAFIIQKVQIKNGWRWIRTTEAICSRFTVCPLWPLGNPSIWNYIHKADDRTRTDNLLITNQLLCQLSHIGGRFSIY